MAISWVHLRELMADGLRSIMSDDPKDVAIRERLHKEAMEREVKQRAYYAEIERSRGITGDPTRTRYRPHRGGLADALQEVVEVDGRAGLIEHLRKTHTSFEPAFDPSKVKIEPYGGDDNRIGWKNVHIVVVDDWGPVGFCEGKPS